MVQQKLESERGEIRWIVDDGRNVANSQLLPLIVEIRRERTEDSHGTLNLLSLSAMKAFTHKLGEERSNASKGLIFVL